MNKLRIVALFICFMLLTQNIAFAYTTGTNYNVKIRGSYEIGNNSGRTIDARLQPILANTIDSLYSMFLDEKTSTSFSNITPVDNKGNRRGETYLNSIPSGSKGILNYEYLVKASTIDYEIDPANVSADYNYKSDLSIYLQPSSKIESDDSFIKNIANQIKNSIPSSDLNNPYYMTKAAYDYVQTHMYYTFDNGVRNKGASFAAHYNVGNCEDYSSLMVALLRANNIPARTVTGFKVKPSDLQNGEVNLITGGVYARHMWVEVYLPGYDWVAFDPVISSSTMQTYAVKDENGITYSSTPSVQAYRPLSSPVYSSFGKLPNLYIKERYDFGEGKNLASVTSSPASFNEYWFGQIVPYSSFTPITSIAIKERLEYAATPVTLSVEGIKSDNTKVVIPSNTISWSSTNPTVAAVDSTGAVSFSGKNGSVTITATYEKMSDSVSTTVNLAPSLTTIVINEPLAYSTSPVQLTATARYSDHSTQALSSGVTWESSNSAVATVDSGGNVSFTGKNGSVTITASYQGQSDSVSTTVSLAPTLSAIAINESLAYSTSSVQLTATARYSDHSTQALSSGVTWESSDPAVATVDSSGVVSFTGKNGSVTITASYQGQSDSVSTTVNLAPTLSDIAINESLAYSTSLVQLTATARYSDNSSQALSSGVTWESSNPTIATVDSSGNVTFTGKNGSITITATYHGMSDSVSTTVSLAPTLSAIAINESLAYSTSSVQLTATARYSDHSTQALSSGVTWESSDPAVATVDSSGVVSFTGKNGSVTITASYQGQSDSVSTTVNLAPTLSAIAINESLAYSTSLVQLTATARYSDNSSQALSSGVTWESSNPTIATVDSSGNVTFTGKNGSITITATYHGMSDSVSTTVSLEPTLSDIAINESLAYSTSPIQLTATARYSDHSTLALSSGVTWESSDPAVATVDPSGIVSFTGKNGSVTITASYHGMSDSVSTTVNLAPTLSAIAINQSLAYSTSLVQLTATARYSDNSTLALSSGVTWESSDPAVATVDSSGIVSFTSKNGSVTITASYQGMSDSVSTTVSLEPTLSAITINESLAYSTSPVPLTATALYSDNSTQTLSSGVAWESSDPAIARVDSNGRVSFTGTTGSVTITAVFQGKSNSVSTTVSLTPTLTGITINESLAYSTSPVQLTVSALYSDSSTQALSTGIIWHSNNPSVATVDSNGRVIFTGVNGSVTITASYDGFSKSVATTVTREAKLLAIAINESLAYSSSPLHLTVNGYYSDGSTRSLNGNSWLSSNPNVATVDSNGRVLFSGMDGSVTITVTYDGLSSSVTANVKRISERQLMSIKINEPLVFSKTPVKLTVIGHYSDNTTELLQNVSWSSTNETVAGINNKGEVTFTGNEGSVGIIASYNGFKDTVNTEVDLKVEKPTSLQIVTPLEYSEEPLRLKVYATYAPDRKAQVNEATWKTDNARIATVSSNGTVTFTGKGGKVTISANYQGLTDSVSTTVEENILESIFIREDLEYSERSVDLTVKGRYADGSTKLLDNVTWSSSNTKVAKVSQKGVVTFTGNTGKVTITAKYKGKTDTVRTTVSHSLSSSNNNRSNRDSTSTSRTPPFANNIVDSAAVERNTLMLAKNLTSIHFTDFSDTASHWAKQEIRVARALNLTKGNPNGTFKPDDAITREEFVALVSRAFQINPVNENSFYDTQNSWAKGYITALVKKGILIGNEDGTFKPESNITRAEMVTIISRLINFEAIPNHGSKYFPDIQQHWAKETISKVSQTGLIKGTDNNLFAPEDNTTRAEAIVILLRTLRLNSNIDSALSSSL